MSAPVSRYHVEPLAAHHDRASFVCGNAELDDYLHIQAGRDLRRKVAAPFVMLDQTGVVVGYYTLSACGIRLTELPPEVAKNLPKYPPSSCNPVGPVGDQPRASRAKTWPVLIDGCAAPELENFSGGCFYRCGRGCL